MSKLPKIYDGIFRDAWFEGEYRYTLTRVWSPGPLVLWVLANPSVADAAVDDPTCVRGMGFSRRWGFGGMVFTNMAAWISTDPGQLLAAVRTGADVVGPKNDDVLRYLSWNLRYVVCAWGDCLRGWGTSRAPGVKKLIADLGVVPTCLGLTRSGQPKHPLMLSYNTKLENWA